MPAHAIPVRPFLASGVGSAPELVWLPVEDKPIVPGARWPLVTVRY